MIALLDPALFVWGAPDRDLSSTEEAELARLIGLALQATRAANARILPLDTYWNDLWRDLVEPLRKRLKTPGARAAINELRKRAGQPTPLPEVPPNPRVWGFLTMFGHAATMPATWVDRMASAASQVIASNQPVMLLVRLVPSRNTTVHTGKQHVVIEEITRWRLYVRLPGAASHTPIDCVRARPSRSIAHGRSGTTSASPRTKTTFATRSVSPSTGTAAGSRRSGRESPCRRGSTP